LPNSNEVAHPSKAKLYSPQEVGEAQLFHHSKTKFCSLQQNSRSNFATITFLYYKNPYYFIALMLMLNKGDKGGIYT